MAKKNEYYVCMKVLATRIERLVIVIILVISFLLISPYARAETTVSTNEPGFTAVAGTEVAVQDKRKNNTTLVSGFAFAFVALVLAGMIAHSRRRIN